MGLFKIRSWNLYDICVIVLLLAVPIWVLWIAPRLTKIPDNFSYTAGLLSLDNFYDEKSQRFEGEQISKSNFSYHVIAKSPHLLVIQNSFSVNKLSGQPIFSVARKYYIDPYTGSYVSELDEQH